VFHARDTAGALVLRHRVGLFEFTNPGKIPCGGQHLQRLFLHAGHPPECGVINKGFVNRAGCALNIFYWNGTSEELVAQMEDAAANPVPRGKEPFEVGWRSPVHYEGTYLTHRFYARLPGGALVQERRVSRVQIPPCPTAQKASFGPEEGVQRRAPLNSSMTFPVFDAADYTEPSELQLDVFGEPLAQYVPPPVLDVIGARISWLVDAA